MFLQTLLSMIPLAVVLLVGLGLVLRNYFRHGRSARIALAGYLLILFWLGSHVTTMLLMATVARRSPAWEDATSIAWSAAYYTQFVAPPLGYALLAWAVFAGRRTTNRNGGAG